MSYADNSTDCAWLTVQKAASNLTAGQTARIQAGTYNENNIVFTNAGNSTSSITLRGDGLPTINGTDTIFNITKNYTTITGITVNGTTSKTKGSANSTLIPVIDILSNGVSVVSSYIFQLNYGGFASNTPEGGGLTPAIRILNSQNTTILNNYISSINVRSPGIYIGGTSTLGNISNNRIKATQSYSIERYLTSSEMNNVPVSYYNFTVLNNTGYNDKGIYWYYYPQNTTISFLGVGVDEIVVAFGNNVTISDVNITNGDAIFWVDTDNSRINNYSNARYKLSLTEGIYYEGIKSVLYASSSGSGDLLLIGDSINNTFSDIYLIIGGRHNYGIKLEGSTSLYNNVYNVSGYTTVTAGKYQGSGGNIDGHNAFLAASNSQYLNVNNVSFLHTTWSDYSPYLRSVMHSNFYNMNTTYTSSSNDGQWDVQYSGNATYRNITSISYANSYGFMASGDKPTGGPPYTLPSYVYDSYFEGGGSVNDVYVQAVDGIVYFINSTFNTTSFAGGSSIYRQWYLDAYVNDLNGAVQNANVTVLMNNGTQAFTGLTDSDGNIPRQILTEHMQNSTSKYYSDYVNYTVNVSKSGYVTQSVQVNLTISTSIVFTLQSGTDNSPVTSTLNYPGNNSNFTTGTLWLNATGYDDFNLTAMELNVWNSTSLVNQTNTTNPANNTIVGVQVTLPNGTYRWNYRAYDNASQTGWYASNYTFTIDGVSPTSNSPANASYTQNSLTTIGWILYDNYVGGYYTVYRNGTIQNQSIWTNNTNQNIWVNTSALGTWNYTIAYNDSLGNNGAPSTVWINITGATEGVSLAGNTIYVYTGRLTTYTEIVSSINLLNDVNSSWLNKNIYVNDTNTTLSINNSDTSWLKINVSGAYYIKSIGGLIINNTKITSWNATGNSEVLPNSFISRPYMYVDQSTGSTKSVIIQNSNISYLGNSTSTGIELWTVTNGLIQNITSYGNWDGMKLWYNTNTTVNGASIYNTGNRSGTGSGYGIVHSGGSGNKFYNLFINGSGRSGIDFGGQEHDFEYRNITVAYAGHVGVDAHGGYNGIIDNVTAHHSTTENFLITSVYNLYYTNILSYNSGGNGGFYGGGDYGNATGFNESRNILVINYTTYNDTRAIQLLNILNATILNVNATNDIAGIFAELNDPTYGHTLVNNSKIIDSAIFGTNGNDNNNGKDMWMYNGEIKLINVNFSGGSQIDFEPTDKTRSYYYGNRTFGYYADILVKDSLGQIISGAIITIVPNETIYMPAIMDGYGESKTTFITGSNGHTPLPSNRSNSVVLAKYYQHGNPSTNAALYGAYQKTYLSYNITVSKAGYQTNSTAAVPVSSWYRQDTNTPQNTILIILADITPPVIIVVNPTNATSLSAGTTSTWINITTDENATCRYNLTNSSFAYADGINFTNTGDLNHSFLYSGLSNSNTYALYYLCNDTYGNVNTQSVYHTFSVSAAQAETPSGCSGCEGGGSSGSGGTTTQNKTNQTTKNVTIISPTTQNTTNTTIAPQEPEIKQKAENKINEVGQKIKPEDITAKEKLSEAEAAYATGQYDKAYSLAVEAEGLIGNGPEAQGVGEAEKNPSMSYYIVALVALVATGAYLYKWAQKRGLYKKREETEESVKSKEKSLPAKERLKSINPAPKPMIWTIFKDD